MNMRKLFLTVPLLLLLCFTAKGQQEAIFSNYIWNPMSFNPAVAGSKPFSTMNLTVREQWVGFEGRPRVQAFNFHTPLQSQNTRSAKNKQLGIGASLINDKIGPINSTTFQGNFAYRFRIQRGVIMSLGVKAEASLWQGKFAGLELADDPSLANDIRSAFLPNFGLGAYLRSKDYFVGLAAPRLFKNEFNDGNANWNQGDQVSHWYLHAGYSLKMSHKQFFKPSIMINYVKNVPIDATISANFEFQNQLWLGASYRAAQSFSPNLGYRFNSQITAGYSYEFMLNKLVSHQFGTHELMLSYDFFYVEGRTINPITF